ncbi:phage holin family protein [Adhaeribacter rhizoryzae]|nr:phage holin family protein [Adhaeribacter rhizoryzae]
MMNEEKNSRTDSMIGNLMGYIDTRIDLIKLELQMKIKSSFIGLLHAVLLGVAGLMALLFFNIFLGLLLNHLLDSSFWGFGILTLFYIILFVILILGVDKKVFQGIADKTFDNTIYKHDKRNEPL